MARIEVPMPQMGESIAEGTVSKWLKQLGETVERDEPILEISTDKVDAEIPSPASGTLVEISVAEGETGSRHNRGVHRSRWCRAWRRRTGCGGCT